MFSRRQTYKQDACRIGVMTGLFWSSSLVLQRLSGFLSIHSGRPLPVTICLGLLSTGLALQFTFRSTEVILDSLYIGRFPKLDVLSEAKNSIDAISSSFYTAYDKLKMVDSNKKYTSFQHDYLDINGNPMTSIMNSDFDIVRKSLIGICAYAILERRLFRTTIPSSIIARGVYAPLHFPFLKRNLNQQIITCKSIASSSQRHNIQKLGNLYGCHHCGAKLSKFSRLYHKISKDVINKAIYIADHMPPTKIANQMNNMWYRKMFNIKVVQTLLPQCYKCFQLQGTAAKHGHHRIVYHTQLRSWHLSPIIAHYMAKEDAVISWIEEILF